MPGAPLPAMPHQVLERPSRWLPATFVGAVREPAASANRIRPDRRGRAPRDNGGSTKAAPGGALAPGEKHHSGAHESAAEAETDKEQQAPEPEPQQIRGILGLVHFSPIEKECQSLRPTREQAGASNNVSL